MNNAIPDAAQLVCSKNNLFMLLGQKAICGSISEKSANDQGRTIKQVKEKLKNVIKK